MTSTATFDAAVEELIAGTGQHGDLNLVVFRGEIIDIGLGEDRSGDPYWIVRIRNAEHSTPTVFHCYDAAAFADASAGERATIVGRIVSTVVPAGFRHSIESVVVGRRVD